MPWMSMTCSNSSAVSHAGIEGVTRRFHKHELIVLEFWLRLYEAGITPQDHAEAAELLSEPPVARTAQESELGHG
jgi:hypothetical protein